MIYVVGCNHGIQQQKAGDTVERGQQRSCFAKLIEDTVREHEIQLICEEWAHDGGATIAHDIAQRNGVRWVNIDTTREDLKNMEIPIPLYKNPLCPPKWKAKWDVMREQFMLRKIDETRMDAQELLIVCGFDHIRPLFDLLHRGTPQVKTVDYRQDGWYQPGIFCGS